MGPSPTLSAPCVTHCAAVLLGAAAVIVCYTHWRGVTQVHTARQASSWLRTTTSNNAVVPGAAAAVADQPKHSMSSSSNIPASRWRGNGSFARPQAAADSLDPATAIATGAQLQSTFARRHRSVVEQDALAVPHIVWQTVKTRKYPPQLGSMCVSSWTDRNRNFDHYVYDDSDLDRFVRSHYNQTVLEAFRQLPVPVMRSDLFRCLPHTCLLQGPVCV